MLTNNHTFEEQLRRLIAEVQTELTKIDTQMTELVDKRTTLARELEGCELTLQGYLRRTGREVVVTSDIVKLLQGMKNHKERIIAIARHDSGEIIVSKAADFLYTKRLIKSKTRMNAYRIVYGLLLKMVDEGIFEKTGAGKFKLIGAQLNLPETR